MQYFSVTLLKLGLMSVLTVGLYPLYWHFKNWQLVSVRTGGGRYLQPLAWTLLAFFLCYSLFARIDRTAADLGVRRFRPLLPALGWIALTVSERLPGPLWMISLTSFLPLLHVQQTVNGINRALNPQHDRNAAFSAWNIVVCVIGGAVFAFSIVDAFAPELLATDGADE